MRVIIVGPNLPDQSSGDFHVHREGCHDISRYHDCPQHVIEARNRRDVVTAIYDEESFEYVWGDSNTRAYLDSFNFMPCLGGALR